MPIISEIASDIISLADEWEPILVSLSQDAIAIRRNSQNRSIRQILGHLIDSASNNIHRTVYLQYQPSPLVFPNYASEGSNDRWIAIQDYQNENWLNMIQLWKYLLLHFCHVINHIDEGRLSCEWIAGPDRRISLGDMLPAFLTHLKLHLSEIEDLMDR